MTRLEEGRVHCFVSAAMMIGGAAMAGGGAALAASGDAGGQKLSYSTPPEAKTAQSLMVPFAKQVMVSGQDMPGFKEQWGAKRAQVDREALRGMKNSMAAMAKTGQNALAIDPAVQVSNAKQHSLSNAFASAKISQFSDVISKWTRHNIQAGKAKRAEKTIEFDDNPLKTALTAAGMGFAKGAVGGMINNMSGVQVDTPGQAAKPGMPAAAPSDAYAAGELNKSMQAAGVIPSSSSQYMMDLQTEGLAPTPYQPPTFKRGGPLTGSVFDKNRTAALSALYADPYGLGGL